MVARDGSVSAVTVLGGDSELARPVVDALRRERYEPGRFRGRPVAVSIYRLISRMEVWGTSSMQGVAPRQAECNPLRPSGYPLPLGAE